MQASAASRPWAWQGWAVGLALALLVNACVPLLLSRLSRAQPVDEVPLPSRRLVRHTDPPPATPVVTSDQTLTSSAAQVAQMPLPQLELPSLPRLDAAIALPAIAGVEEWSELPLAMPAVISAGQFSDGAAVGKTLAAYDQPPQRLSDLDLARFYPRVAKQRGTSGHSLIRLTVASDGSVSAVTVIRSSPPGVFERAAEALGRAQRFLPARKGGQPVAALVPLAIEWNLER